MKSYIVEGGILAIPVCIMMIRTGWTIIRYKTVIIFIALITYLWWAPFQTKYNWISIPSLSLFNLQLDAKFSFILCLNARFCGWRLDTKGTGWSWNYYCILWKWKLVSMGAAMTLIETVLCSALRLFFSEFSGAARGWI